MLYCPGNFFLLKSIFGKQLKPDLKLNGRVQLDQALTSSDTATAEMTNANAPYKTR